MKQKGNYMDPQFLDKEIEAQGVIVSQRKKL